MFKAYIFTYTSYCTKTQSSYYKNVEDNNVCMCFFSHFQHNIFIIRYEKNYTETLKNLNIFINFEIK